MKKAVLHGYTYYVTQDGQHFYNSKGKERPIQNNKHRSNRRYIKLSKKAVFMNIIVANAFPEICGELFDGCVVHHKDGDPTNDSADNLVVMNETEHCFLHAGKIVKYSLDGKKLGVYPTSQMAAKSINNKRTAAAIRECLCGNSKTCAGFIWRREF